MALKAYEDACMRAELFGQPKPDKEDFLSKHKHLDIVEFEEVDIKTTENTAILNEDLNEASGALRELNTILTSTQTKLNRFKGVCGTVTNFFRIKLAAKDNLSYSSEPSYIGQTNYDKDYVPPKNNDGFINTGLGPEDNEMTPRAGKVKQNGGDINAALADLEKMEVIENSSLLGKAAVIDHRKQVSSQGVCGTVTNFFRIKLAVGQPMYCKEYVSKDDDSFINTGLGHEDNEMTPRAGKVKQNGGDINAALADLDKIEAIENSSLFSAVIDHVKEVSSQVRKSDNMRP